MQVAAIAELLLLLQLFLHPLLLLRLLLLQRLSAFAGSYFSNVFPRLTTQFSQFLMSNCGAHVVAKGRGCGRVLEGEKSSPYLHSVSAFWFAMWAPHAVAYRFVAVAVAVASKGIFLSAFMSFITVCIRAASSCPQACPRDSRAGTKDRGIRFIQSLDISGALSFLVRRSLLARFLLGPLCVSISHCPRLLVVAAVVVACVIA